MFKSSCRGRHAGGPALLACLIGAGAPCVQAVSFDSSFMQPFGGGSAGPNLDLEAIAQNAQVAPGVHRVTLRLNQSFHDRRELRFDDAGNGEVRACLSPAMLDGMGVKLAAFIDQRELDGLECVDLPQVVEGALVTFDPAFLALDISVPQVALRRDAAGYVAPEEWDAGINAGILNYQFAGTQGHTTGQGGHSQYALYLNGGLNLAGWRLRGSGSYNQDAQGRRQWQRAASYAQTDLPGSLGTFTLGESFTAGDVFDSLPFRGVQVASDIGMLPDSMQGYAPVIRGVAETRARVEVRHNGYSLYSTFVPPGPFEITDLNAASGSGDLEVIITEADGRERRFTQPYATLGNLLRENTWRYGLTFGEYNAADESGNRPGLAQATLAYGLPYDYTLSGGLLGNDFYRATQVGLGKNLGNLGAISLDVTLARTEGRDGHVDQGRSYGIRYGKAFATGTSVRFAGYRYSTQGYRDFSEAVWQHQGDDFNRMTKRSRVQASINQNFGNTSLYLNLSHQDYWNTSRRERQLQLGVNTVHRGVSYGLYASKSLVDSFGQSSLITFNVSVPLGGGSSATLALTRNSDGSYDQRAGYRGRSGHLNYALDASHAERSGGSGSASLNYLAPFAQLGAGVSAGERYQQVNVSVSGSLLAHSDGIALGQTLGETLGLVHVADTPGVGLGNAPGSRTDSSGYALIPYLTPYRRNRVSLDTSGLDHSTEIENGVTNVVPRRGAVVKAEFAAQRVEKVLLSLRLEDGGLPPFGAQVVDAAQRTVGVVGPGGQALLAFEGGVEALTVRWGASASQQCRALLALAGEAPAQGYRQVQSVCRQGEVALLEHHAAGRG